ncbi:DUF2589 domain-containing protein (plasmid) [Vibrio tubiashii]|uniref:DUF2589 domain-containing protein n=1 Tax=Vibrio tubiashii TaxID=29498 RepID=UPI00234EC68C|nr:DUF2589 domain-containing protein [Vibrio tubiashii]WCP70252.1 DUF2589 domain-containing protein [Vibrio tubiashii]
MGIFSKNKPVSPQYLDGIVRGLNYVANCASDMSLSHYQNLIEQYFDYDETASIFTPKVVRLQLDPEHEITMPLIAVTDAKGLYLDELEVDFSVRVTGIDPRKMQDGLQQDCPQLVVDIAPRQRDASAGRDKDVIDFKVKFKSSEAPECVMKVIDKYNTQITPQQMSPREGTAPSSSSEMTQPEA